MEEAKVAVATEEEEGWVAGEVADGEGVVADVVAVVFGAAAAAY